MVEPIGGSAFMDSTIACLVNTNTVKADEAGKMVYTLYFPLGFLLV